MQTDIATQCSWLAEQWSSGFADVMATLTSTRPAIDFHVTQWPGSDGAPAPDDQSKWWHQALNVFSKPAIWVGARPEAYSTLSRGILETLGMDAPAEEDIHATWLDLVAQAGNVLAQRIAASRQKPLTCGPLRDGSVPQAAVQASAEVKIAGGEPIHISIGFSQELIDFMSPATGCVAPEEESQAELRHGALDIQLKMVVTLGRTTLSLGDVFRLSTGAIIEFPQSITQHAEVLINDRLVGRGQVVVLNGNYAVQLVSTTFKNPGGSF